MDEQKPEDDLKADLSDRHPDQFRQSSEYNNDPRINLDNVDLDAEDSHTIRANTASQEHGDGKDKTEQLTEELDELQGAHLLRKRRKASAKPVSRQYVMIGLGVIVLLLLIAGIGSALKSPPSPSTASEPTAQGGEQNNLPTPVADSSQSAPQEQASLSNLSNSQPDTSVSSDATNPSQGQSGDVQGQPPVEMQSNGSNSSLQQQESQVDNGMANSTLPTEPATVVSARNNTSGHQTAAAQHVTERKHTTSESKTAAKVTSDEKTAPAKSGAKATADEKTAPAKSIAKADEKTAPAKSGAKATANEKTAPAKSIVKTTADEKTAPAKHAEVTAAKSSAGKPVADTQAKPAPVVAATAPAVAKSKTAGNAKALKSAPADHYTLQLSSSTSYSNLNKWAKKEKLKNFIIYETVRDGQPWYVLVSGVYASRDEAKNVISSLPEDVQAKNPWAKPLHQVQAEMK